MRRTLVSLHDQVIELRCPPSVADDVEFLFRDNIVTAGAPAAHIAVEERAIGLFSVLAQGEPAVEGLTRGDLATFVMEAVVRGLIKDLKTAIAIHAGAVAFDGKVALIAGNTGAGKSSLVAWLVARGFDYLTDEIALLLENGGGIVGLPRALVLKPGSAEKVVELATYRGCKSIGAGEHIMLRPSATPAVQAGPMPCSLVVFPRFVAGSELRVESLSAGHAALRLVAANLNARNLGDGGFRSITNLARQVPAVVLQYGDFRQLEGTADVLVRFILSDHLDAAGSRRFLSMFGAGTGTGAAKGANTDAQLRKHRIPAPTPRREAKRLTIGMATFDDYDGAYFSLQALRLYHPEILDEVDFLVVDNHPDGPCAEALKALERDIPNYRYVPFNSHRGTAASKNAVFSEAGGKFVLCLDSHVFIVPGALTHLMKYLQANPGTCDLLQGPLIYDDLSTISTHFQPGWRGGMYGVWEVDGRGLDPDAQPFEIPMQGMGLFCCRRAAWPGFNPGFRGFGGEEGYIHEKFRRNGGRTICLPFLRWMHRFRRPMGLPYTNRWDDRIRNYIVGFRELGLPTAELERHFRELLGQVAGPMIDQIKRELPAH